MAPAPIEGADPRPSGEWVRSDVGGSQKKAGSPPPPSRFGITGNV